LKPINATYELGARVPAIDFVLASAVYWCLFLEEMQRGRPDEANNPDRCDLVTAFAAGDAHWLGPGWWR
jgi:hypothetical protein